MRLTPQWQLKDFETLVSICFVIVRAAVFSDREENGSPSITAHISLIYKLSSSYVCGSFNHLTPSISKWDE
ncbi:hypothetical protein GGR50DRAFT_635193 [Xylaria sp. CBS 124048]|nr:hypothetical protein GGR50DRAFT_635193 [Xylaria sp. CBS 124048]